MNKLKLLQSISQKFKTTLYIGKYEIGNDDLGYGHKHEWFAFFKRENNDNNFKKLRNIFNKFFSFNERFNIFETQLKGFKPSTIGFSLCYKDENGCIYSNKAQ